MLFALVILIQKRTDRPTVWLIGLIYPIHSPVPAYDIDPAFSGCTHDSKKAKELLCSELITGK